jgi:RNA polymerase sigma-70 factor (ECF subfamily)
MDPYQRYGRALLRKAERLLQSRADAQDVVHALFVDLLEKKNQRDVDLPYLYRAVTNRCLSHLRDETNRARLLSAHDESLRGPVRTRLDERVIDLDLLGKLVLELDEVGAEVLAHHFFDDMNQEEVASLLGVTRKTIGSRLERIREIVQRLSEPKEASS